jgi:hypothetical protein
MLKSKNKAIVLSIFLVSTTVACYQANAQAPARIHVTKWAIVDSGLSDLLNNGWMPINITTTDVATPPEPGLPNLRSPGIRSVSFTYLLTKNGKYINCKISDPEPTRASYSACRSIN